RALLGIWQGARRLDARIRGLSSALAHLERQQPRVHGRRRRALPPRLRRGPVGAARLVVRRRRIAGHGVPRRAAGRDSVTLKAGDTLDLAPMGFSLLILKSGDDSGGGAVEPESTLAPRSGG